jgi:hypothetical protein
MSFGEQARQQSCNRAICRKDEGGKSKKCNMRVLEAVRTNNMIQSQRCSSKVNLQVPYQ